jgi:1-hydroxycarotenoid 3,4-desaturase
MHRLPQCLAALAAQRGAALRYGVAAAELLVQRGRVCGVRLAQGERIAADAVVFNGDVAALAAGRLGAAARAAVPARPAAARSLSALTWNLHAPVEGFALLRHNVFFSDDYGAEFDDLFRQRRVPRQPTVYVCAQDRAEGVAGGATTAPRSAQAERLLVLVNAPADGDSRRLDLQEALSCQQRTFQMLARCGLQIAPQSPAPPQMVLTQPADFEQMFPATGGALYGQASHGWRASFQRPASRSRLAGLYLAGGSTHPGPGVPMAALSGRLAAACLLADTAHPGTRRASTSTWRAAATPGGTSTPSATTARTPSP